MKRLYYLFIVVLILFVAGSTCTHLFAQQIPGSQYFYLGNGISFFPLGGSGVSYFMNMDSGQV